MQIWHLSNNWTILTDILAWFIIHMSFAYLVTQLSPSLFNPRSRLFRLKPWEQNGAVYQKYFRVRDWKKKLPDGAALFRKGFRKKKIRNRDPAYLERFLRETCRGELAHWLVFGISPIFFLWNPSWAGWVCVLYGAIANLPCIMVQRYNRPFIQRLLKEKTV
ncbi:glycosyl-4,4'-diaponeurosporenoate acyltransferase [Fibrobacterota bacterium]